MYSINYGLFLKKYSVFRLVDIKRKNVITDKFPFPLGSVIHILDNIDSLDKNLDTPYIEYYPFLNRDNLNKLFIYHNSKFENISLIKDNDKLPYSFKFLSAGLHQNNRLFNKENISIFKPIFSDNDLHKLNSIEKCMITINHNPLYRFMIKSGGNLRSYYKFDLVFSSMIGFMKRNFLQKHKFLFIPLNHKVVFKKENFLKILAMEKINISALEYDSFVYYLLIHLFAFISSKAKFKSYFSIIDELSLSNLNIVFFNDKLEYQIFNLSILKELCLSNEANKWKILSGINALNLNIGIDQSETLTLSKVDMSKTNLTNNLISISNKPNIETALPDDTDEVTFKATSEKFETDLLNDTFEFIDSNEVITPNQKQRLKEKAKNIKKLKVTIDDKAVSISSIINNRPNDILESQSFINKLDKLSDPSYGESKVLDINQKYFETFFYHDLFQNILNLQKGGLFLTDYQELDIKDDFNMHKDITFKFEDIKGKKHTVKCKIPLMDKDGYFKVNGIKSIMKQQMVNLPICKIDRNRVSLSSNFNKTLVEKNTYQRYDFCNNFIKSVKKHNNKYPNDLVELHYQDKNFKDIKLPYEYTSLGRKIKTIKSPTLSFIFNYEQRFDLVSDLNESECIKLESKYGVLCGKNLVDKYLLYFMDDKNRLGIVNYKVDKKEDTIQIINLFFSTNSITPSYDWCHLKILGKAIPIIFILGYKFGLDKTLKYLKVKYKLVDNTENVRLNFDEMSIKFNNKTLIYKKYPLLKSWIINGFVFFSSLKNYDYEAFELPDTYYELFQDKNISINYLKGIDNFFTFFIDGITRDVLKQMNEPTNPRDLLIRSVELLITEDYKEPAALANFRQRSLEKINGIMYNEISRQYSQYLNNKTKDMTFSINTESVFQRILQDQSVVLAEEINPIHYLKERTAITHAGFSGRSSEAFVEKDRKYPSDGVGILSEATPDSGKVAINAFLSFNPNIKDIRGFYDTEDTKKEPGNILSVSGSLLPFVTNDDPKRANFANIQISHHIPTEKGRPSRVRTGLESIIGDFSGSLYAIIAKDNGQVLEIDTKNNICLIQYKNKDIVSFNFGNQTGEVSGTILNHHIKLMVEDKKRFKVGDVLAYNTGFFSYDYIFKTLNWNHGVFGKIAILEKDETLEDGSSCTKGFAENFVFKSVYIRPIKITADLSIIEHANVGDKLDYSDSLIKLEYKDISLLNLNILDENIEESEDLLQELNRISIKSKHKGELMKFRLYYTGDKNEFHESIVKLINSYDRKNASIYRSVKQSKTASEHLTISQVKPGTRIKNIVLNENEVLLIFYISENIEQSVGDKVVLDSSLKSVIGKIYDKIESKSGIKIDMMFGAKSIFNRIILSPIKSGILERILETVEDNAVNMYFEK